MADATQVIKSVSDIVHTRDDQWAGLFEANFGLSNTSALLVITALIIIMGALLFYGLRAFLLGAAERLAHKHQFIWTRAAYKHRVFHRIVWLIPGIVVYVATPLIAEIKFPLASIIADFLDILSQIYMICVVAGVCSAMLNSIEARYSHFLISQKYSIKSYLQLVKIILFVLAAILIVSLLFNQSPGYLLTGLGAMTAIVILIFRDSILGFVASIQLSAYDMARVGDWVEFPKYGADGTIIDLSLNTIKIQNFDNTIVTIPSIVLLTDGIKNWRGMNEAGARRIKRSINIDVGTVKICNSALHERLSGIPLLHPFFESKSTDSVKRYIDPKVAELLQADKHCVTNIELFRHYLQAYLSKHPGINKDMVYLVRELQDSGNGLPLEVYGFANEIDWAKYELIQANIFDYIYAILPLFELRPFQAKSSSSTEKN